MNSNRVEDNVINRNRLVRRRRVFFLRRMVFVFLIFIIFLLVFMNSPIFDVKNVNISGNKVLSKEYITQELNNIFHKNIIFDSMNFNLSTLSENKYVKNIHYKKKYPNTINVIIEEHNIDYFIHSNGLYYIFDRDSKLIDILDDKPDFDIMEILGVKIFPELEIDQNIFSKDGREVQWLKNLSDLLDLNKSNIKFDYVDLSDVHNVILGYNEMEIKIGSNSDLREKLNIVINTINSNEKIKDSTGYIDVRSKNHPVIFFDN